MIRLKPGVRIRNLHPAMVMAAMVVEGALPHVVCVITSANDSKHMSGSLHYKDRALDFRTKDIPTQAGKRAVEKDVAGQLGPDFDVLLEHIGGRNEHLHVEYDP